MTVAGDTLEAHSSIEIIASYCKESSISSFVLLVLLSLSKAVESLRTVLLLQELLGVHDSGIKAEFLLISGRCSKVSYQIDTNHLFGSKPLCWFKFAQKTDRLIFYQSHTGWAVYYLSVPLRIMFQHFIFLAEKVTILNNI